VLESVNPAGIFMYADIGYLEGIFNVIENLVILSDSEGSSKIDRSPFYMA